MKIYGLLFAALASTASANTFSDACDGKSVDDTCVFTLPDGSSMYGTCFEPDSASACGPDATSCIMCGDQPSGGGNSGGSDTPTVKVNPSVSACENKSLNDACGFTSPDGTKVTGSCADQGAGACGPTATDSSSDSSAPACYVCASNETNDPSASGPTATNECTGLEDGAECVVIRGDDSFVGVCTDTQEDIDTSDGKMSCEPVMDNKDPGSDTSSPGDDSTSANDQITEILAAACENLKEGAACTFMDPAVNKQTSGNCLDDGTGTLQCDIADEGSSNSNFGGADDPLILACSGEAEGSACEFTTNELTMSGTCSTGDDGALFCAPALNRHLRH